MESYTRKPFVNKPNVKNIFYYSTRHGWYNRRWGHRQWQFLLVEHIFFAVVGVSTNNTISHVQYFNILQTLKTVAYTLRNLKYIFSLDQFYILPTLSQIK